MTADEIRAEFNWNTVIECSSTGFHEEDMKRLTRLQIMAMGELAAQLAESRETATRG